MNPEDAATRSELEAVGAKALECLSEREQLLLRLRFGLDDGRLRTREEVGREWGVSPERIRQVESKALYKLRRSSPGFGSVELPT